MSKEIKIGILGIVAILGSVWGYAFLKGRNLLTNSYTFYVAYENVEQLSPSSPVLLSGVQVGTVTSISIDQKDLKTVVVKLDIENNFGIHKNTKVRLINAGIMGQKALELDIPMPCSGEDCAKNGVFLQGEVEGLLKSLLGENTLDDVFTGVGKTFSNAFDTINYRLSDESNNGRIVQILRNIDLLTAGLQATNENLNRLIGQTNINLNSLAKNMQSITSNIQGNNQNISNILQNFNTFSDDLAQSNVNESMASLNQTMDSLQTALSQTSLLMSHFTSIGEDISNGKGSMGKLLKDKELYDNLNEASKSMDLLLQDFRLHPKRYVNVSVFGKKEKPYVYPENDPAKDIDE